MKLWLVQRPDEHDYDVLNGALVRAGSEAIARQLVAAECGYEGHDVWFASSTRCIEVTTTGVAEVLLCDFTNG